MTVLVISVILLVLNLLMPDFVLDCTDLSESQSADVATHFATSFSRLHSQFHRSTSSTKAHSLLQILNETTEAEVQLHCVTELGQASTCPVFHMELFIGGHFHSACGIASIHALTAGTSSAKRLCYAHSTSGLMHVVL